MTLRRIFLMYVALMSLSAMANGDAADNAAAELEGVIESYELAYRMQSMASEVFDLGRESPETLAMYGGDLQPTDVFARPRVRGGTGRPAALCRQQFDLLE
jgi:hypothetical protein